MTGLRTFLGRHLPRRLAARGASVVGIDLYRPQALPAAIGFETVDLTGETAASDLADVLRKEEVETVVHLAFRREPTPDLEGDHELDTIGSLRVVHACEAAGVSRLVVASSTMVYGARPDNPNFLEEDHPLQGHPEAHSVQDRREVEALVADWARRHPAARVTVLRPCWVMGPRTAGPVCRYLGRPVVPTLLGYDPLLQFVHEEDCLRAFERAALEEIPGVFNVVGRGVAPLSVLIRSAGKRPLPVPAFLLHRMRAFPSRAQTGDAPEGFYDYLRYPWVAAGEKGWAAFGEPRWTTREAWMSFVSSRRMRRYH